MSRFDQATAVKRLDEGRYRAELDAGFGIAAALNGGYLMAVLLRAAVDASPHVHPLATSASFLRVAKPGPADIVVENRKVGRTVTSSRISLVQDDKAVIDAQVTTGTLDATVEPTWSGPAPTALPPRHECVNFDSRRKRENIANQFADQVEMWFDPATMGWLDGEPGGSPEMRAHFRLREEYEPDAFALALAVDALPPVVLNTGAPGWAPTVELTWHMRAVPAPGWLAVHGSGRLVRGGWFDEEVEVWDSAGRLVAQSRQIALVGRA